MITQKIIPLMAVVALLGGCSGDTMGAKQTGGGLLGAGAGALLGAQFGHGSGKLATTAIGTLLGAYAGSEAGKSLDHADQMYAHKAEQQVYSAPVGQQIRWNNPESGNSGTFTPTREGTDTSSGAYCREYQTSVNVGGKAESAYGTACRQPDGSWKVIK